MAEEDDDQERPLASPFPTSTTLAQEVEEDYGPIEAFVGDDDDDSSVEEIDAEDIDVLPTSAEVAQDARSKLRRYSIFGALCVMLTTVAVMVPVSLTVLRHDRNLRIPTEYPSAVPSTPPSHAPTTYRYTEYLEVLSNISSIEDLTTRGTAQFRASRWIYKYDPMQIDLDDPKFIQRYIAAVFYYSTSNGRGWADCYPGDVVCTTDSKQAWFSYHDECDWFGFVQCNQDGFVTRFVIMNNQNGEGNTYHGNNLDGTLPQEFGYLTNLTDLTILKNPQLKGTIPTSFSKLTNLHRLRLINNGLDGKWNEGILDNMTKLIDLNLNYNSFNITLPSDIARVNSLQTLSLAGNTFHGKIPESYGSMHRLERMELHENHLSGEVPSDFFIPTLSFLSLQSNNLTGAMPETICNMAKEYQLNFIKIDCDDIECDCCHCFIDGMSS